MCPRVVRIYVIRVRNIHFFIIIILFVECTGIYDSIYVNCFSSIEQNPFVRGTDGVPLIKYMVVLLISKPLGLRL